ncbi:DUF1810 domain-containing protein [Pseudomonas sp. p50]|jgi:uncharacterized protein (DUF1810 family)|uniref:DUF1810 domain-containing protein n=1 Tax=Pseudomonas sp. p50(2008) TaxID=2816832 RepID=UPI00188C01EF|nr:DUF1810 domain-containing protein [Pseudomonas sp. p50(2008)]MBF4558179.1 DUF1810 domain-containing protein [Pseudomonas sp. p50(2008)]MBH2037191.1 DUF1810 domain-containing protein [Pseudomonadales bacterium]MBH2078821.1 DUF1810 domain-containing protein [Pseudomonadales bacterium]
MRSTDPLDSFNLQRFIQAQAPVFDHVQEELIAGRKRRHWMWFIFPQIAGLGGSEMSRYFAIQSAAESAAYLNDPLLGSRLRTCTQLVLNIRQRSIAEIFGHPDDLKFHSSMTLFAQIGPPDNLFNQALDQYFHGIPDDWTLSLLDSKQAQLPTNQG